MNQASIICKATTETYLRLGILLLAILGIGIYFFYDAAIGYPKKNEAYISYQRFKEAAPIAQQCTAEEWVQMHQNKALIGSIQQENVSLSLDYPQNDSLSPLLPIPLMTEATLRCPIEFLDHSTMSTDWQKAWLEYSIRMGFDPTPKEKYTHLMINLQRYAGYICMAAGFILLLIIRRTMRRRISINGTLIYAAGKSFDISEIEHIDLRNWSNLGIANFKVKNKTIKIKGMVYGGFKNDAPAEQLMQSILAQYKGKITRYEES